MIIMLKYHISRTHLTCLPALGPGASLATGGLGFPRAFFLFIFLLAVFFSIKISDIFLFTEEFAVQYYCPFFRLNRFWLRKRLNLHSWRCYVG